MGQDFYQPYFEAVKQILNGIPVKELDDIRQQCNETFLKSVSPYVPEQARGYTPEAIITAFVADAENKILMGMNTTEAYGGFKGLEPADFRQRGRIVLEHAVKQYLK
ncbi:MAG: hypothetical protein KKF46_07545 [Nanoarchaeota archaeon]|nr:hypothetical protein [Nanoarchaeota archaeon]MBU1322181.1 hypothetical protein [Nanoarchaeota archaeon]MBU1597722.1 hypothetical protein [Nanoarchaeota archaeon]MBU2442104.1 hypothetical protein [Nanoarchaeota archaeon]